jgi:hypothetical protein
MRVNSRTISLMVMVLRHGQMVRYMREISGVGGRVGRAATNGIKVALILEIGKII